MQQNKILSTKDMHGIKVAGFKLWIDCKTNSQVLNFPPWHAKFEITTNNTEVEPTSVFSEKLILHFLNHVRSMQHKAKKLICRNKIWELWQDQQDNYHFLNPEQHLLRHIIIDSQFSEGTILGNHSNIQVSKNYPLPQVLEIVLFANWFGGFGDVILHALGIAIDGKGYAIAGHSGVGKSTLAATLSNMPGVTILGEDQVILRLIDNRFWIFGTPWHLDRSLCSPAGVALEKVYFLKQRGKNVVELISPMDSVTRLLQTAFIPYYRPEIVKKQLDRLALLADQIPFFELSYQLGTNILQVILGDETKSFF